MNELVIQMIPPETTNFLSGMYLWGIEVIKVIQVIKTPVLTAIIKSITALGTEVFYLPVILFIFWWADEKQGLRFGILILVAAWINSFVKDLWKQPRPFNLDPSLGLAYEPTYGAPSGHAQQSLAFWVAFAAWLSNKWKEERPARKKLIIWAVSIFMVLLIAYTRLYLGVHFPTDIFAGWIFAGLVLAVYFLFGPRLQEFFGTKGVRFQNIAAAVVVMIMNGLYPQDRMLPAVLLGFCLGYTQMKKRFPFCARAEINGKKPGLSIIILRSVTGLAGVAIIYLGLKLIFPAEGSSYYELGRFVRYCAIGFWASAGAPLVFQRIKLASRVNNENTGSR